VVIIIIALNVVAMTPETMASMLVEMNVKTMGESMALTIG